MQSKSDAELLKEFAASGAEPEFAEIVSRHIAIVYSAALRQVGSPDLARDVCQTVFSDLARKSKSVAASLGTCQSLAGWLYRGTRFAALNLRRVELRRKNRERVAMDSIEFHQETPPDWTDIRPILDEAMHELDDSDREALLMRYFKNQDLGEVGLALGISADAAQKRVSRALERLRGRLAHRGITTTGTAICAAVSANAVQAAPSGLAAAVSASAVAGSATAVSLAISATKTIAMTTLQKITFGLALTTAVGAGIYEAARAAHLRTENDALQRQQTAMSSQIGQLQDNQAAAARRLLALNDELAAARSNLADLPRLRAENTRLANEAQRLADATRENDPSMTAALAWKHRVDLLKEKFETTPGAKIPEMDYATDEDWLSATKRDLNTDEDYRRAMASLRGYSESHFETNLQPALSKYLAANNQQFPTNLAQLEPFFSSPVDQAVLDHWTILSARQVPNIQLGSDWIVTQASAPDPVYDSRFVVGPNGSGSTGSFQGPEPDPVETVLPLIQSYLAANNGQWPANPDPSDLLPYATNDQQRGFVNQTIKDFSTLSPADKTKLFDEIRQKLAAQAAPAQ